VSYRERAMVVSTSCFLYVVGSYRPSVLVCLGTIVVVVYISSALYKVIEALAS
jgi:hypothetical protein